MRERPSGSHKARILLNIIVWLCWNNRRRSILYGYPYMLALKTFTYLRITVCFYFFYFRIQRDYIYLNTTTEIKEWSMETGEYTGNDVKEAYPRIGRVWNKWFINISFNCIIFIIVPKYYVLANWCRTRSGSTFEGKPNAEGQYVQ